MKIPWSIPKDIEKWATALLLSEDGVCSELAEKLVARPDTDAEMRFSGVELTIPINMDMLIRFKNPPTIKAFLRARGPKLTALFCCNGLRLVCHREEEASQNLLEAWDYFKTFHLEEVNWSTYPVLGATAKAVAEYAAIDLGIDAGVYARAPYYRIMVKNEMLYRGDDIEEFCETLYKELIK